MVINGGSGLAALEFADCLLDSPEFRENLNRHEKELDKTSQQIKRIIKEIKDLLQAAKSECNSLPIPTRTKSFLVSVLVMKTQRSLPTLHHVMEFFIIVFKVKLKKNRNIVYVSDVWVCINLMA